MNFVRRAFAALLALLVTVVLAALVLSSPHSQRPAIAQSTGPCSGFGWAFSLGSCGSAVATPTPAPLVTGIFQADYFRQAASNTDTAYCQNGRNQNAATSTYPLSTPQPTTDSLPTAYLKMFFAIAGGGLREGSPGGCYGVGGGLSNSGFMNSLYNTENVDMIYTTDTNYTASVIASEKTTYHGLRSHNMGNEWDAFDFASPTPVITASPLASGSTTLTTAGNVMQHQMIPGSEYSLPCASSGTTTFTLVSSSGSNTGTITPPTTCAVNASATITRVSTWEEDLLHWYQYFPALVAANSPSLTITGPSLAHPINGQNGFPVDGLTNNYLPGVQVMWKHDYPQSGYNPEGSTGDGSHGYTLISHAPCSGTTGTSYSLQFNNCAVENALGAPALTPSAYSPMESTEWGYSCVQDGSAPITGMSGDGLLPGKVCLHYVLRGEAQNAIQGTERTYYFGWTNCVDGPPDITSVSGLFGGVSDVDGSGSTCSALPDNSLTLYPKPAFNGLYSYVAAWADLSCNYNTCAFTPSTQLRAGWSNPGLPLNLQYGQFSNGTFQIGFWLGAQDYDPTNTGSCANTTSCYLTVASVPETVTINGMTAAQLWTIDDTPSDPTPAPASTTAPDLTPEQPLHLCPLPYASTNMYGCWETPLNLTVTNQSVTIPGGATSNYQILRVTVPTIPSPSPTTSPLATPTPYPVPTVVAFPNANWVAFPPNNSPSTDSYNDGPPQQALVTEVYGSAPFSTTVPCRITNYTSTIGNTYGCVMQKSAATIANIFSSSQPAPQGSGQGFIDGNVGPATYFASFFQSPNPTCYGYNCSGNPLNSGGAVPMYITTASDAPVNILNGGCQYGNNTNSLASYLWHYKSGGEWPQLGPDIHITGRDKSFGQSPWYFEIVTIGSGALTTANVAANAGYWPIGSLDLQTSLQNGFECPTSAAGTWQGVGANGAVTLVTPTGVGTTPGPATVPSTVSVTDVSQQNGTGLKGTAGGLSVFAGAIRPQEVLADDGTADTTGINHGVMIVETCDTHNIYNPATGNDGANYCSNESISLDYGGHLVINQAPSNVGAGCDIFSHAYLKAFYYYGGYMNDIGGSTHTSDYAFQVLIAPDIDDTIGGGASSWASVISTMNAEGVTWYSTPPNASTGSRMRFSVPDGACGIWTGQGDGHSSNWVYLIPPY